MFGGMRFWLDRGRRGFRLDAIPTLFEDRRLRDEPVLGGTNAQGDPNLKNIYTDNLPEVHTVIRRMRAIVDQHPGTARADRRDLPAEHDRARQVVRRGPARRAAAAMDMLVDS